MTNQHRIRATVHVLGPSFWETVLRDPRTNIPPYDPITGYRSWAELEANPPQFEGILSSV
ncbi:hypothetical protein ACFXCZ_27150 [Streptomyces sp. NPDC059396]|uniref:hypothetical protein n=1 Tax=Streptomyces sp. NPDC059396 TaxID=3346819 RepID=UPI0036948810